MTVKSSYSRAIKRLEKRGYEFTAEGKERLKGLGEYNLEKVYEEAFRISPVTGEYFTGKEYRAIERRYQTSAARAKRQRSEVTGARDELNDWYTYTYNAFVAELDEIINSAGKSEKVGIEIIKAYIEGLGVSKKATDTINILKTQELTEIKILYNVEGYAEQLIQNAKIFIKELA